MIFNNSKNYLFGFPGSGQEKHCFVKTFCEALCASLVMYVNVRE